MDIKFRFLLENLLKDNNTETRFQICNAYEIAIARAEAAERRVAELEAAQEWRPYTEKPQNGERQEIAATAIYNADDDIWDVYIGDIYMDWIGGSNPVVEWRPLPPPPQAGRAVWMDIAGEPARW